MEALALRTLGNGPRCRIAVADAAHCFQMLACQLHIRIGPQCLQPRFNQVNARQSTWRKLAKGNVIHDTSALRRR